MHKERRGGKCYPTPSSANLAPKGSSNAGKEAGVVSFLRDLERGHKSLTTARQGGKRSGATLAALACRFRFVSVALAESALPASDLHHQPRAEDEAVAEALIADQFVQFVMNVDKLQQMLIDCAL